MKAVQFCPNCGELTSAKGYATVGGQSTSPQFSCSTCGYVGFPIQASLEEYKKMDFSSYNLLPQKNIVGKKGSDILFILILLVIILFFFEAVWNFYLRLLFVLILVFLCIKYWADLKK